MSSLDPLKVHFWWKTFPLLFHPDISVRQRWQNLSWANWKEQVLCLLHCSKPQHGQSPAAAVWASSAPPVLPVCCFEGTGLQSTACLPQKVGSYETRISQDPCLKSLEQGSRMVNLSETAMTHIRHIPQYRVQGGDCDLALIASSYPVKDYLFPAHLNVVRGTKTATEPGGGGSRGRCSGGKSSKQEKANRSLEKGREGQWEGRMARARSCQFSPCQSQPDVGQRGGASA